jgi:hypothetical protein
MTGMGTKKSTPRWSDVKTKLGDFDRADLIGYGVGDDMDDLLAEHGLDGRKQ